jgi:hypothetical protein
MMKKLVMVVLVMVLATAAWATTLVCNIDRGMLYQTGRIRVDEWTGTVMYQHRCDRNHYFWLTTEQTYEDGRRR